MGANSTMSKPRMFFLSKTSLKYRIVVFQSKPPGSGVPVAGIMEGSNTSRSMVRYTLSVRRSMDLFIQSVSPYISSAKKQCSTFRYGSSELSMLLMPTCTRLVFLLALCRAQAWLYSDP